MCAHLCAISCSHINLFETERFCTESGHVHLELGYRLWVIPAHIYQPYTPSTGVWKIVFHSTINAFKCVCVCVFGHDFMTSRVTIIYLIIMQWRVCVCVYVCVCVCVSLVMTS